MLGVWPGVDSPEGLSPTGLGEPTVLRARVRPGWRPDVETSVILSLRAIRADADDGALVTALTGPAVGASHTNCAIASSPQPVTGWGRAPSRARSLPVRAPKPSRKV